MSDIDWKARAEQLERERDEALQQKNAAMILANKGFAEKDARLAKVSALVEALRPFADDNHWVPDHGGDGAIGNDEAIKAAQDAVATWEQE